ncbi:MAG: hypothetical protein LAT65_00200 [Saccharospirillum sp.]|nr:hypothetical protein [Saccharospirillum sp.]
MNTHHETVYAQLHQNASEQAGTKLFTVMVLDRSAQLARRVYSSHPVEYPVTGSKPMRNDRWSQQVIEKQQPFIANKTEEFSDIFSDYAIINQLGCESALNLPLVDNNGHVIGTVNYLGAAGLFTDQVVSQLAALTAKNRDELIIAMHRALPH